MDTMTVYNDQYQWYITDLFAPEDPVLVQVRQNIPLKGLPAISIQTEEGRFLQFLARSSNALRAIEIGTLGGYSGIWIARGLAPGGRLITLDKDSYHAEVAREHFQLAGLADQVEVIVGDAHQTLHRLSKRGPFDFVFIDAEKEGYQAYFIWAVDNVRTGGLIATHNVFRGGTILDPDKHESTRNIQAYNNFVAHHLSVISTIYPAGDPMLVAV